MRNGICVAAMLLAPLTCVGQPADVARAAFQKVCGECHVVETVTAQGRTRDQWRESINSMVARGAKGTGEEFALILDYLTTQYGPASPGGRGASPAGPAPGGRGRGPAFSPGPADKQVIDEAAANRGRKVYAAECITCHGTHARGSDNGADLIRSEIVLHDRYGSTIGPFLRKGHPTQTTPAAQLTQAQIEDLSHTIHQEVYNTLRAALQIQNILTGDPQAGASYFNGEGGCSKCHSPAGDLAHIGSRMGPPALQQSFLFPGGRGGRGGRGGGRGGGEAAKPVTVTVTPASGAPVTGALVHIDDFNVALRDGAGEYRSFKRTHALKVVTNDPAQAHHELLDKYTDKNIHDTVAYLETLK
ncbi:MAG: c-type cytochrome [Bryobacteraceae bacterium]